MDDRGHPRDRAARVVPHRPQRTRGAVPHPRTTGRHLRLRRQRRRIGGCVPFRRYPGAAMKVLLRNPRRELELPAPRTVEQLLRTLDVVPESVLVIRNDTLAMREERRAADALVEIRP